MGSRPAEWPEPFLRARDQIGPLLEAAGFRPLALEQENAGSFAEFGKRGVRLRLVWEAREQALWLEAARASGGAVISRWTDVEWSLAGERLPLDRAIDQDRIDRLERALRAWLETPSPSGIRAGA